jgi:hypothetical protein
VQCSHFFGENGEKVGTYMLIELSNEQRRQIIDVSHVFSARQAARKNAQGHYRWVTKRGNVYLMRKYGGSERSLGRKSPQTEAIIDHHRRDRLTYRQSGARLEKMARVNRALRINRVPNTAAKVLRALDDAGLLGDGLFVIGTNAMYGYEMKAGVLFESDIIATDDFDLLWDARESLRLAAMKSSPEGILGILKSVDPTFSSSSDYGTRAQNAKGYYVDLFCSEFDPPLSRIAPSDIDPIATAGAEWLAAAPKIDEMVIGEDGLPARMVCVDPRIFALHKAWLSTQPERQPKSRPRDRRQAQAVAGVARDYLGLKLDRRLLRHLPEALASCALDIRG